MSSPESNILEDLGLGQQQHLTLMYKIVHGTVALTPEDLGLLDRKPLGLYGQI